MRHLSGILLVLSLFASLLLGMLISENVIASPPSANAPSPPKTKAQIAAEAYALQAQANAAAGRKTSNATDGTGGTPIQIAVGDATSTDFNGGTHYQTASFHSDVEVIHGDDFGNAFIEPFWRLVGTDVWTEGVTNLLANGGVNPTSSIRIVDISSLSLYNSSIYILGLVGNGNGCNAQNITIWNAIPGSLPGDSSAKVGVRYVRTCGAPPQPSYVDAWYWTTGNVFQWWSGSAWGTTYTPLQMTAADVLFPIYIEKTATLYKFYATPNGAGSNMVATIAISSVRNGATGDRYAIGDNNPCFACFGGNPFNIARYFNWNLAPGFPNGTFVSRPQGAGDWTSRFTKLNFTGSGIVGTQIRFANNSDMSTPSSWMWVTNQGDFSSMNWRGGFFQYRLYMNTSTTLVRRAAITYFGQSTGDAPSKTHDGQVLQDSAWRYTTFRLVNISKLILPQQANRSLIIDHSRIDATGADKRLFIEDRSAPGGSSFAITYTITIRNSTLFNASRFFNSVTLGGIYRSGTAIFFLDNVSMGSFNSMWDGSAGLITTFANVHDSTIRNYNKDNASYAAVPKSVHFNRVRTFYDNPRGLSGSVTSGNLDSRFNYMEGGFLQFVFGSSGQDQASGPGFPVEFVNWSSNYVNNSRHTAFGSYGTSFGHFANPTLKRGYYHTIYHNYINNSRYITIQSSGNTSGLRVIGNYIQGVSPSFTEAIGVFEQNHDFQINGNMIWNMNSTNNRGITISCFIYNVTVANNIIYDVGVWHIRFECMGLKFKNATGTESSDYSWKGMSVRAIGNYLSGARIHPAVSLDSGYAVFDNNTITDAPAGDFEIFDGWGCKIPICTIDSYVWIDWIDGFPTVNPNRITWPVLLGPHQKDFSVRELRTGRISVSAQSGSGSLNVTSPSTHWGTLSARCIQGTHWTTDADVFRWTGHTCGPIADFKVFSLLTPSSAAIVKMPKTWYNKTISEAMLPKGNITWSIANGVTASIVDTIAGSASFPNFIQSTIGWSLTPGDDYVISFPYNVAILAGFFNFAWLLAFIAFLALMLLAAFALKKRREGG